MECEFCGKTFSQKSNLKNHQRTAKKCLKLRGLEVVKSFKCQWCAKSFTQNITCQRHEDKCIKKGEISQETLLEKIERLEREKQLWEQEKQSKNEKIEELQDMINKGYEKQMSKSQTIQTIVINNYTNNPNLNELRLEQDSGELYRMVEAHQDDLYPIVERMIKKCIFRPGYQDRCLFVTDAARNRVIYREDNIWKVDKGFAEGMKKICGHVYKEIEPILEGLRRKVEYDDPDESQILQMNNKLFELEFSIRNPNERSIRRLKRELAGLFHEEPKKLES